MIIKVETEMWFFGYNFVPVVQEANKFIQWANLHHMINFVTLDPFIRFVNNRG